MDCKIQIQNFCSYMKEAESVAIALHQCKCGTLELDKKKSLKIVFGTKPLLIPKISNQLCQITRTLTNL